MHIFVWNRRRVIAAAVTSLALVCAGCNRHKRPPVVTVEETPALASVVATADAKASTQLLAGFYGVEQNSWRWTAGKFSVLLRPPQGAATKGAVLQLKFTIPEVAMGKEKTQTLTGFVNGTALAPESYSKAGEFIYTRDVAANLLPGDSARVDFSLEKTMQPSGADHRDLGVVATMVGLQAK